MQYEIVQHANPSQVEDIVRAKLEEGWEPLGGVSCALSENDEYRYELFAQAIIKR